jgi:hypothetical protein
MLKLFIILMLPLHHLSNGNLNNSLIPTSMCGDQDLHHLIEAATAALHSRGLIHASLPPPPPTIVNQPRVPDMWENAKVEQIICAGIKPPYDGSPDWLIPTMNLINIRRKNEVWHSATYLQKADIKVDLVLHFMQMDYKTVVANAKRLWDAPDAMTQSHTRGTETYNSHLLGVFLMNSLTPDFASVLHSRIDSSLCSDGPLLLFTMCQHIHRNHLTFVETIKNKIRSSTLTAFNNDIPKYLRFLNDNIKLITSTGA